MYINCVLFKSITLEKTSEKTNCSPSLLRQAQLKSGASCWVYPQNKEKHAGKEKENFQQFSQ